MGQAVVQMMGQTTEKKQLITLEAMQAAVNALTVQNHPQEHSPVFLAYISKNQSEQKSKPSVEVKR